MNVVLVEPEIPPNTGNVARLCAGAGAMLHLIEPFGFQLDDRRLKRAGLDYWEHLRWRRWPDWGAFQRQLPADARLWLIESHGARHYAEVRYGPNDWLVFGRETAGLPKEILARYPDAWLRIPLFHAGVRSLNLSNCVALVLYEALRQQGFAGEV
ncbi:MAG: tRNA (cytidine(34)-2'-O)-methyltransferase [Verrucomicrobiota bacterium]|jgi:tRNA (cytidine/uridine-2'-O-)-methyltransferase